MKLLITQVATYKQVVNPWDILYSVFIPKTKGAPHGLDYCSSLYDL